VLGFFELALTTQEENVADTRASRCCPKCDSDEVIRDGVVFDKDRGNTGALQAGFLANPNALFFKGMTNNSVRARLCGNCGFVELFVEDPKGLYAEYQRSRNTGG